MTGEKDLINRISAFINCGKYASCHTSSNVEKSGMGFGVWNTWQKLQIGQQQFKKDGRVEGWDASSHNWHPRHCRLRW